MPAPELTAKPTTDADITPNSAILGGAITSLGEPPVTRRGIVIAPTTPNLDLSGIGEKKPDPTTQIAVGAFTVNVTGLQADTDYSYAAYATDNAGATATSRALTFRTKPATPGTPSTRWESFMARVTTLVTASNLIGLVVIAMLVFIAYSLRNSTSQAPESDGNVGWTDPGTARGFITLLFSVGTVGIALILTLNVILSSDPNFKERFDKAKEILTIMIGIFGTIMGFYFGSANPSTTAKNGQKIEGKAAPGGAEKGKNNDIPKG